MSEPKSPDWTTTFWAIVIVAVLVFFGKLFWEPTNESVKRIERMAPCAQTK